MNLSLYVEAIKRHRLRFRTLSFGLSPTMCQILVCARIQQKSNGTDATRAAAAAATAVLRTKEIFRM